MEPNKTELEDMPSSGGAEDIAPTVDAEKLAALAAERDELREQVLRARAEFDNFRKRTERERLEASEYSAMEAVRQLLPTLDDFVRALKAETADKEYAKGMELIYGRLFETLKKMGLEPIESEGKPFDPHVHHAVEMAQTEEAEDGVVLAEYQCGYNFKGRLLRPAMVKVAVRS